MDTIKLPQPYYNIVRLCEKDRELREAIGRMIGFNEEQRHSVSVWIEAVAHRFDTETEEEKALASGIRALSDILAMIPKERAPGPKAAFAFVDPEVAMLRVENEDLRKSMRRLARLLTDLSREGSSSSHV